MKIIFIRHAEPDYEAGTLSQKGIYESQLLAKRVSEWNNITDIYCSPIKRAIDTAAPSLKLLGRKAITLDWLAEFKDFVRDDSIAKDQLLWPWDFIPEYLDAHPELFKIDEWLTKGIMTTGHIQEKTESVFAEFDNLLAKYGYIRDGLIYRSSLIDSPTDSYMVYDGDTINHMKKCNNDETTIVLFCHQEISLLLMSHLLNISGSAMWQNFFVAPTGVTVFCSEERIPGQAYFRCQMLGNTSHLINNNEPISFYGYMTPPFQK